MKRSIGFHPRYADLAPPLHAFNGTPSLVAIKLEKLRLNAVERIGLDFLVRSAAGLHAVCFAEVEGDCINFPLRYRERAETLAALVAALDPWLDVHLTDPLPMLSLFDASPDVVAVASDEHGAIVPGLATYDRLIAACDRYRRVAPYAAGRNVVDLSGGTGYGTHLLLPLASSVRLAGATDHAFDRALNYVSSAGTATVDLALALGLDASAVDTSLARARELVGAAGTIAISASGAVGAEALRSAGHPGAPLTRVAADAQAPLDEFFVIITPEMPPLATADEPAPALIAVAERPLRVLFVLRMSAERVFGGDVVQVRETAQALCRRGHAAEVTTAEHFDPSGFDIVHFSNITAPFETLAQMQSAAGFSGAVVMMPIFTDHADETVWAMRVQSALFSTPSDDAALDGLLDLFAKRQLTMSAPEGRPVGAAERLEMAGNYLAAQREICRRSDYFIANAHAEMHRVYRYLDPTIPYAIAPSAANPAIYSPQAATAFLERFRFGDFVLVPGRFESRKNQLMVMRALRESGRRIVLVGRDYEGGYGELVRAYLGSNSIVMPHMPEPELAGAIAAARVVVMASYDEVVSLTSLNAAACGTSLVLTRQSYEHEYLRDDAEYCDPVDLASVRAAIDRAWDRHEERAGRRCELSERVRREYTWDRSAELMEAAYYRVLASNPRGRARREATA